MKFLIIATVVLASANSWASQADVYNTCTNKSDSGEGLYFTETFEPPTPNASPRDTEYLTFVKNGERTSYITYLKYYQADFSHCRDLQNSQSEIRWNVSTTAYIKYKREMICKTGSSEHKISIDIEGNSGVLTVEGSNPSKNFKMELICN